MKKVVVIGGGFAGAATARKLEKDFEVTLIDTKDYFEFTPSVLRTIVEPAHIRRIQVLHRHYLKSSKIIRGAVTKINNNYVKAGSKKIRFDYLVIASGSSYNAPFKEQKVVHAARANHLRDSHKKLSKAKSVLIIGGGIVGVELAGEICDHYKDKKIIMVHPKHKVIHRSGEKAIMYAEKILAERCISIIHGERVVGHNGKVFLTDTGRKIKADISFLCTGIKPNSDFVEKKYLDNRGFIKVNKFLQVRGLENVFAIGDVTNIKEEKLAQTAEIHANVVADNICRKEKGRKLRSYKPKQRPMLISIGKHKGIFIFNGFTITGIIPVLLKIFVEWKTMRVYR